MIGDSLGSLLAYDSLCQGTNNQNSEESPIHRSSSISSIHQTQQSLHPSSDEFKINSYFKKIYYHYYNNQIDKLLIQRDNILFENNISIKDFTFWKCLGYEMKSYHDWRQTRKYEESFKYRYFYNYQYIQCSKCSKWRELDLFQYFSTNRQNQDQIIVELNSFLEQEISCDNKYIKNRY